MSLTRRAFIKQTALLSNVLLFGCAKNTILVPLYDSSEAIFDETFDSKLSLRADDTVLFIGDSITDSDRNRQVLLPNVKEGLGRGYVRNISDYFSSNGEYKNLSIYNRGVAGNKAENLANRWRSDCLDLQPSVVSILVGINDLRANVSPADFYKNYRKILNNTRYALPQAKLVICEPFLLPNIANYSSLQSTFHEYRKIVRILSKEYKTVFIPYYQYFMDASESTSLTGLLSDGVHPTAAGASLLSSSWERYLQS